MILGTASQCPRFSLQLTFMSPHPPFKLDLRVHWSLKTQAQSSFVKKHCIHCITSRPDPLKATWDTNTHTPCELYSCKNITTTLTNNNSACWLWKQLRVICTVTVCSGNGERRGIYEIAIKGTALQEGDDWMMKRTNSLHRFQQIIYGFIEDGNTTLLMH